MGFEVDFKKKKLVFCLVVFLMASLVVYWLGLKIKAEEIIDLVGQMGVLAPIVFALIMALTYVVAPLSGTPAFFAGFVLFKNRVQIYNYFAVLLAATVNFWIARRWGRKAASKLAGRKNIDRIDRFTKDYGVKSLIFLRLFQGHFHDFISYAYGLTNLPYRHFIVVSALTPIPWLLFWQFYVFKKVEDIGDFTFWFVLTMIPFWIISLFFARKLRRE